MSPPPPRSRSTPRTAWLPTARPTPRGAATGAITAQPASGYGRLQRATLAWNGGPQGLDRPVDRAFVSAQRRKGRRWITQDSDLGLAMLWKVDANGRHSVAWEIPLDVPRGTYRFVVTAKRYRLTSRTFRVRGNGALQVVRVPARPGRVAVGLQYPGAKRDVDLTHRPQFARGGVVRFRVGNRTVRVRRKSGKVLLREGPGGRRGARGGSRSARPLPQRERPGQATAVGLSRALDRQGHGERHPRLARRGSGIRGIADEAIQ